MYNRIEGNDAICTSELEIKFHEKRIEERANYLYWFKRLQYFYEDKEIIKSKNILIHSTTTFVDTKIVKYKGKEPVFV